MLCVVHSIRAMARCSLQQEGRLIARVRLCRFIVRIGLQNKYTQGKRNAWKIANRTIVSVSHSVHVSDPFEVCLSYLCL